MNTDLKPNSEVLEVFETIQRIFIQEMKDIIAEFSEDVLMQVNDTYELYNEDKRNRYIIIENRISLRRSNKALIFMVFESRHLNDNNASINNIRYYMYIYIHNSMEESDYFKDLSPLYYLKTIGKGSIMNLFPEQYVAIKDNINKEQIYEYVRKYLNATKILLGDSEVKRLLYEPTYWVYADPYNFF